MKSASIVIFVSFICAACSGQGSLRVAQNQPWSKRIADSFLLRHPGAVTYDTGFTETKWNYEQGLMLWAMYQMSLHSGDAKYLEFLEQNLDQYVDSDGSIKRYKQSDHNLDLVAPGRALLVAFQETKREKYRFAADTLRRQLGGQPRTKEGGFWHKQIYPYQMWLDGLYMAEPFYAWYSVLNKEENSFDDIANQFGYAYRHTLDEKTGLCYHGWDESRDQRWADPVTGQSPSLWGRSMGWYMMGLVDVLDYLPRNYARRGELLKIFENLSAALLKVQDAKSGMWYQVVDQQPREGNYLESSATCMFTYAFAKGANKGYLDKKYYVAAETAFDGVTNNVVTVDKNGFVNLHNTCKGAGLGGNPYRDGSFEYYISEAKRTNDIKGVGPFLLAAIELEKGKNKHNGTN